MNFSFNIINNKIVFFLFARIVFFFSMQIMREAACDFFPDFDGHNHVEGSCPKEWVSERHNYHAMAFLSRAYNFQWSRFDLNACRPS